MGLIPQTTCRRCHRQYSSLRGSCPYCGTPKPKTVRRPVPESDSAVKNTPASDRSAETLNWQLLFGGVILLAVVAAVLALVSSKVGADVASKQESATTATQQTAEAPVAATAVPVTPEPTPEATAAPTITSLAIQFQGSDMEGFTANVGDQVQLTATYYPVTAQVTVKWSSSDDTVATVDDTGLVTCVGGGDYCYISAEVEGFPADRCQVVVRG